MSLMDMFSESLDSPIEAKSHQRDPGDIKTELNMILHRHGLNAPDALLEELTSLYIDPPPWNPW